MFNGKGHGLLKKLIPTLDPTPLPTHVSAQEVIKKLGKETFDLNFSFAIVRNPSDWQVSLYHFMRKDPKHHQHELAKRFKNFENYLEWRCNE